MKAYVVMYMSNIMEIFYDEKEAEEYCDKFSYHLEVVDIESAVGQYVENYY